MKPEELEALLMMLIATTGKPLYRWWGECVRSSYTCDSSGIWSIWITTGRKFATIFRARCGSLRRCRAAGAVVGIAGGGGRKRWGVVEVVVVHLLALHAMVARFWAKDNVWAVLCDEVEIQTSRSLL